MKPPMEGVVLEDEAATRSEDTAGKELSNSTSCHIPPVPVVDTGGVLGVAGEGITACPGEHQCDGSKANCVECAVSRRNWVRAKVQARWQKRLVVGATPEMYVDWVELMEELLSEKLDAYRVCYSSWKLCDLFFGLRLVDEVRASIAIERCEALPLRIEWRCLQQAKHLYEELPGSTVSDGEMQAAVKAIREASRMQFRMKYDYLSEMGDAVHGLITARKKARYRYEDSLVP